MGLQNATHLYSFPAPVCNLSRWVEHSAALEHLTHLGEDMPTKSANSAMESQTRLHSPEVFRLLVDTVADYAIFLLDPEGTVSSWNPGAEQLKQYKPEEIIGRHFSVFYTHHD